MIATILAATLTFTATATGVEKGTAVEFAFAGRNTDRDYETMFLIDDSVDAFCRKLEQAGFPRGKPTDTSACDLWPVGCPIAFDPPLTNFISVTLPQGIAAAHPIYTGGTRLEDGRCEAGSEMPASVFSLYSLAQSPIVFDGIYEQGSVYGSFTVRKTIKKGERLSFTISTVSEILPKSLHLTVRPGNSSEILNRLKSESEKGAVDVLIGFSDELTVAEASAMANALSVVDSARIKINGFSNIFYRAFLPLVKWRDRKERLAQPFELTIGTPDRLVYIDEDWSVDGPDPKLTPQELAFEEAAKHPKTDTCFIFATANTTIARVVSAMTKLRGSQVRNWYVFADQ